MLCRADKRGRIFSYHTTLLIDFLRRFAGNKSQKAKPADLSPRSNYILHHFKPKFTNNMKGMGMLLAESTDHGVWPTVPFMALVLET